jgi:hypothetical protein
MNEKQIIEKRWKEVDRLLSQHLGKYKKLDKKMRRKLQDIFNSIFFTYEEINNYTTDKKLKEFKEKVSDFLEDNKVDGYIAYELRKIMNKKKIKNSDILEKSILMAFAEQEKQIDEIETELFEEISELAYEDGQDEAIEEFEIEKKPISIPKTLLMSLLALPTYRGYKWQDYRDGDLMYYARQIYNQTVINMQQERPLEIDSNEFSSVLNRRSNKYLKKKDRERAVDQYSGALNNQVVFLVNQIALQGMLRQGCTKVRFVAVVDDRTTEMCRSLNGQIFDIFEMNVFSRYSAEDGKNIIYRVKGLQLGANLPPIDNHFHYCRSTIYPAR